MSKTFNGGISVMVALPKATPPATPGCATKGGSGTPPTTSESGTHPAPVETAKTTSYPKLELIGNSWTDNGGGSDWTTERQIKLTDSVPSGAAKQGTQYIVTIEGTTDKPIGNFCIEWVAFDDYKKITGETARKNVSGSFTYKEFVETLPDVSESDFNRGYLQIRNSNNPAVSNRGDIAATLTNVRITIEISNIVTLAGGSTEGYADGTGAAAKFDRPGGVAFDSAGNLYVADSRNSRIRKITPEGVVTTFAGSTAGYVDGTGATAKFNEPSGLTVDSADNVYVADSRNSRIRKITPEGVVTTLAGSTQGYADGTGAAAKFYQPNGMAVDSTGNVYVADSNNHRIRKISSEGVVTTFAGSTQGYADGIGAAARFYQPEDVAIDSAGNLYVAESRNSRIRKITPEGAVTTLAGSTAGYADGTGTAAKFGFPRGVAIDSTGNLYVADWENHRIRKITPEGVVTTLDGEFYRARGVAVDSVGNVYVSGNTRIHKITISAP